MCFSCLFLFNHYTLTHRGLKGGKIFLFFLPSSNFLFHFSFLFFSFSFFAKIYWCGIIFIYLSIFLPSFASPLLLLPIDIFFFLFSLFHSHFVSDSSQELGKGNFFKITSHSNNDKVSSPM